MFISLRYKLFGSMLAAVVVVVVGMLFLIHLSFGRGFLNYVNTEEAGRLDSLASHIEEAYGEQGDWQFIAGNSRLWRRFLAASTPEGPLQFDPMAYDWSLREPDGHRHLGGMSHGMRRGGKMASRLPEELKHLFELRVILLDADKRLLAGPKRLASAKMVLTPLKLQEKTVGYLGHIPQKNIFARYRLRFIRQQRKSFGLIALGITLLASLIAFPLAGWLLKRINALAAATHLLAAGKFETRLEAGPADELGRLVGDFNTLALTLEKNEKGRQQWLADISHELRTPLSVLRGEIEAIEDGVRAPSPDALGSLHSEVMRLNRLVDDLFQLSLADLGALNYRKEKLPLGPLLIGAVASFRPEFSEKGLSIELDLAAGGELFLFADGQRLRQLFTNILQNSLRYTDCGGILRIGCKAAAAEVEIIFEDSLPGVSPKDHQRLFERLYRVEGSRNRESGGAGLGLAICRKIVEAHGGRIVAKNASLGGLAIQINLPLGDMV